MELRKKIEDGLKEAMRSSDHTRKRTYRLLLASIKFAEVEKGSTLDDQAIQAIIQKEIKIRRESIDGAQQAHRDELSQQSLTEISILESFLPRQMSDEEIVTLIKSVVAETGAQGPAGTGQVMKAVMPKIQGRAPGDRVSRLVREILTNS
jgi:uncharacterized protein YqeY